MPTLQELTDLFDILPEVPLPSPRQRRQLPANLSSPNRKQNPFVALKTGKKIIVIAVVDAGSTSFFRFGQGEFTEWPVV